jgi:hypothetical protein
MTTLILTSTACLLTYAAAAATQYVYPTRGQDKAQQARDEAACTTWASQQTGFDPAKKPKASKGKSADVAKTLSSPEAAAAISAVAGKNASSVTSITSALGGSGGSSSSASSLVSQAVSKQPQTAHTSGEADFNRARAACLSGKGYSVQ